MVKTICKGEKVFESPITGKKYLVTKWEDKGNGLIVAIDKKLIPDELVKEI